jgi:hypothetical protein
MEAHPLLPPPPSLEDISDEIRYNIRIQLNVASLNTIPEKTKRKMWYTHIKRTVNNAFTDLVPKYRPHG